METSHSPRHDGEPWREGDAAYATAGDIVTEMNVCASTAMMVDDWSVDTLSAYLYDLFADDSRSNDELALIAALARLVASVELDPTDALYPTLV